MNPKKQVVMQAIADLIEVKQKINEISELYLNYAPSILTVFDTDSNYDPAAIAQLDDIMETTLRERRNIANNLFHDYNTSEPNDKYYNPNPMPVFSTKDFKIPSDFKPAWNIKKAHNSPMIVTHGLDNDIAGKPYASNADRAIKNIDIFIDQLKRKLSQRKDLQEEKNIMNAKRETIARAKDLERNLEELKQAKEQLDSDFPRSRRSSDFIQRGMEDVMKDNMMKLFRERQNIANRLFRDYTTSHPNDNYYDPNPTPVFDMGDFSSKGAPGKPNRYPAIVGSATKSESRIDSTIRRINTFINQLKTKLRRRKDLQEEKNIMKINKSYIKQLVKEELEAVINESSYEDMISDMEKDGRSYGSQVHGQDRQ